MKVVYIMRGITGSGKSTRAKELAGDFGVIHSTDDFFLVNGVYKFDPKKIEQNHEKNKQAFEESLKKGISCVICDNTNILLKHMEPYEKLAIKYGYDVVHVEMPLLTVKESYVRSTHNVPKHVIKRMLEQWEDL